MVTNAGLAAKSSGLAMPRARRIRPTPLVFYGYPDELIADWCAVSRHTAYLYKIGARKPSRQALRLFVLNRDGRVLDDTWKGWPYIAASSSTLTETKPRKASSVRTG